MATLTLSYIGSATEDGQIKVPKRLRTEVAKAFAGKRFEVFFRTPRNYRSNQQLRYYFGVCVVYVLRGFVALGHDLNESNPDDILQIHEFLKHRFLPHRIVCDANGEELKLPPTTKGKTTSEMMDYIAQIQQFAAEFLNVNIPDPGEQIEMEL